MNSLADRIAWLVEQSHGGKVRAAAADIRIPQQTLAQLKGGDATNPRAETLKKIGRFYGVTSDWLLYGQGAAPAIEAREDATAAYWSAARRWARAIEDLHLERDVQDAVYRLPFTIRTAIGLTPAADVDPRDAEAQIPPEFADAIRLELQAWTAFFEGWIRLSGLRTVSAMLTREAPALQMGFNLTALALLAAGTLKSKAVLSAAQTRAAAAFDYAERFEAAHPNMSTIYQRAAVEKQHWDALRQTPKIPPSNRQKAPARPKR